MPAKKPTMRIQTLVLTVTLLLFATIALGRDEARDDWIQKLQSERPSEFRIAQVYLARRGCAPLDELDELSKRPDDRLKQRLKEIVALMLLNGIGSRDVQRHRHLYNVCEVEFAQARKLVDQLTKAVKKAEHDNPDAAEGIQWYLLDPKASDLAEELFLLHGWGVPALSELIEGKSPFLKMTAIHMILVSHGARLPTATFERLKRDKTPLVRFHGDYSVGSTIANEIRSIIRTHPQLIENDGPADWHRCLLLLHKFQGVKSREEGVLGWPFITFDPKWSFDEYWAAAQTDMERVWDSQTVNMEPLRHNQSIHRTCRLLRRLLSLRPTWPARR